MKLGKWILGAAGLASLAPCAAEDRTITKVVKLLQGMLDKSKVDGDADRELFGKFKCYCDTQKATKTEEIEALSKQIEVLSSRIQEILGSTGSLSTECAGLKKALAANEQARAEAESIRAKEHADFEAIEADLTKGAAQMEDALGVLAEVGADHSLSLAASRSQFMAGHRSGRKQGSLAGLESSVRQALDAASALLKGEPKRKLRALIQAPFTGDYSSQSGEVIGILKNMRDTFKSNLETAVTAETHQKASHEKLIATKTAEHEELTRLYNEKQDVLGTNDDELATKRTQLDDATEQKSIREEFLAQLLPSCAQKAAEYQQRTSLRGNEDAALSEAIAILNSDAAFAAFGKVSATSTGATGPDFLQRSAVRRHAPAENVRQQATQLLRTAGLRDHSLRLTKIAALLAAGNPFDSVLREIGKVIALLAEEGKVDKQKLDWCNSEREVSNAAVETKTGQITALVADIDSLSVDISAPETGLKAQIAATEVALRENADSQKQVTATREAEKAVFTQDIQDLSAAQELLTSASNVLKKYYEQLAAHAKEKTSAATLAGEEEAMPETWEGEGGYQGQSESGGKVQEMLEYIIEETKKEEQLARTSEAEAEAAYESLMEELTTSQSTLQTSLAALGKSLAEKEQQLLASQEDLKNTEHEKATVEAYLADIKPGCDFIVANFDERESHRASETTALEAAVTTIKGTAAYKSAVAAADREALGECLAKCEADNEVAECKACLAGVTVPAYCAGHPGTAGC